MTRNTNTPLFLMALNWLADMNARYRERQMVKRLSDEALKDVGLSRRDLDRAFLSEGSHRPADTAPLPLGRHI